MHPGDGGSSSCDGSFDALDIVKDWDCGPDNPKFIIMTFHVFPNDERTPKTAQRQKLQNVYKSWFKMKQAKAPRHRARRSLISRSFLISINVKKALEKTRTRPTDLRKDTNPFATLQVFWSGAPSAPRSGPPCPPHVGGGSSRHALKRAERPQLGWEIYF